MGHLPTVKRLTSVRDVNSRMFCSSVALNHVCWCQAIQLTSGQRIDAKFEALRVTMDVMAHVHITYNCILLKKSRP